MKVRGERECKQCGTRWSYYNTGSIECPECESLLSVGLDDRVMNTDTPVELDLSTHRSRFGEARETLPSNGVAELKSDIREYTRKRGFIRGGKLLRLDAVYLAARELLEAVDVYDRLHDPNTDEREYLLSLLAGAADGTRPTADDIPESVQEARGMAAVRAVEEYRSDLLVYLDEIETGETRETRETEDTGDISDDSTDGTERTTDSTERTTDSTERTTDGTERASSESDPDTVNITADAVTTPGKRDDGIAASRPALTRNLLEQLRDRTKRVEALGGDVAPADADALIDAANAIGEFIRDGDDTALTRAQDMLSQHSI